MADDNSKNARMKRREDERDVCESILASAMDSIVERLASTAEERQGAISADDIRTVGKAYIDSEGVASRESLREHIHLSLIQHEQELWNQTRRRPFDRLLVKRFSHLFPHEGELDTNKSLLSRRALPGFFMAIEMMTSADLFEQCQQACKGLLKTRREELGDKFLWRDFYDDSDAMDLVNDIIVVIVHHFDDFDKRMHWLHDLINSHLSPPDDYAFEGTAIAEWHLLEEDVPELMKALFSDFLKRLGEEGGHHQLDERYGMKARQSIEKLLTNLGVEL
ncbi:MAG: hypothetical protein HN809_11790 [Rhodospirillaceae bacterium]|nr:hypothetical protein [Rhodospirillaceae bacterium]